MTTNNGIVEILTTHTVSVDSAEGGGFDYYRAWCYGCQCLIGDKSPAEHQAEMLAKDGYGKLEPCQRPHVVEAPRDGYDWPPNCSSDDYECCASGSCEVCRR